MEILSIITGVIFSLPFAILAIVIFLGVMLKIGYSKAPTDMAFIISGLRKEPRILIGRAGFKIPFFEMLNKLYLGAITVDVKTQSSVPTADFINVNIDSNVNVRISTDPAMMAISAQNFLDMKREVIAQKAREILEGNTREIIGQMKLTEIVSNRASFSEKVRENAAPDLGLLGLEIVSFNIQNIRDDNGIIDDLGIDNIETIRKSAAIAKSDSRKDIAIAEAENARLANEAQVAAAQEIAVKDTSLAMKKAELQIESDTQKANADAAYEIQKQEKRKILDVTSANADIARRERDVELQKQEIALKEKELEATIKKQADAEKYAAAASADAELYKRQKEAEAKRFEMEQEAIAARATAEAQRFTAEQKAAGIEAIGLAEAAAKEKMAEAMEKYGQAAVLDMYFKVLPEVVKNAAEPLNGVDSITMYGEGNSAKMVGDVMKSSSQIIEALEGSTGLDIKQMLTGFTNKFLQ